MRRIEALALVFTLLVLLGVEECFVYLLRYLPPDEPLSTPELLTMPPWHKKPRFEVSLLLMVLAGFLFSAGWALCDLWRKRHVPELTADVIEKARRWLIAGIFFAMVTAGDIVRMTLLR